MKTKLPVLFFVLVFANAGAHTTAQTRKAGKTGHVQSQAAGQKAQAAIAPEYALSEEQKRAIRSILTKSKLEGAPLALLGAQGAKEFDENILSETPSAESDQKATRKLLDGLDGVAELRLQTIRDVVALLTPEQKQRLRAEMRKPGTPTALLEVLARVFKLPEE
jgi:hypothetical protein